MTSFGLSEIYQANVYENFFYLKYYGGFSIFEAYNLPVQLRNWFVQKLIDQLKLESEQIEKSQRR